MSQLDNERNPIEELAEDFMLRMRQGHQPTIEEYVQRHPELANQIRDLFPTLEAMEGAWEEGGNGASTVLDQLTDIGDQLGDFKILREIGRGGMGVVYEAYQQSLGRRVALKVLAPSLQSNKKYLARFQREARAAAKLQHSNIVPVHGVSEQNGFHFYVMQFINGKGLDEILEELIRHRKRDGVDSLDLSADKGNASTEVLNSAPQSACEFAMSLSNGAFKPRELALTAATDDSVAMVDTAKQIQTDANSIGGGTNEQYCKRVARLGFQAADALSHAHEQGICHRDIKPGNLLLDVFGNVWITDFGLVKLAGEESLTETGDIVGTLRYMAPECLRGEFDSKSDIYGLGLTIYELLGRRKAFDVDNRASLTSQIIETGPKQLADVPRDLSTIVHKAIAVEPEHRYQSSRALADDLDRYLKGEPILARRVSTFERFWRWSKRNRLLAATSLTVALLLLGTLIGSILFSIKLNGLASARKSALLSAKSENRDAKMRLVESNILRAEGWSGSGLQGQRFQGLNAIREALPIARELQMGSATIDRLRNAAIASLSNFDVEPNCEWDVSPALKFPAAFDANLQTYAVATSLFSPIEVRRSSDQSLMATIDIKKRYGENIWLSPNGKYIAFPLHGIQGLVVIEVATGREVVRLKTEKWLIRSACFCPDSKAFALATNDKLVRVFSLESGEEVFRQDLNGSALWFRQPDQLIICHRVDLPESEAESEVANSEESTGSNRGVSPQNSFVADFVDLNNEQVIQSIPLQGKAVYASCGPNGLFAVLCDIENDRRDIFVAETDLPPRVLEVYQLPETEPFLQVRDDLLDARSLRIGPNGRLLAIGKLARTVLLDVKTGSRVLLTKGQILGWSGEQVAYRRIGKLGIQRIVAPDVYRGLVRKQTWQHVTIHPSNKVFVTPDKDGVRIFRVETGEFIGHIPGYYSYSASFTPDGKKLYCSYWNRKLGRFEMFHCSFTVTEDSVKVGEINEIEFMPGFQPHHLDLDSGGKILVADDKVNGYIGIKHLDESRPSVKIRAQRNPLFVAISPDGKWAATGTWHGTTIAIFDIEQQKMVREVEVGISDVEFTNDSNHLACVNGRLIDVETGKESLIFSDDMEIAFNGFRFARKQQLACFSAMFPFGKVILVDTNNWRTLAQLQPNHQVLTKATAISDDGKYLIVNTLEDDLHSLYLWDLELLNQQLEDLGLAWEFSKN